MTFATVRPSPALALLFVCWRKPSRPGNRSSSWRFLRRRRLQKEEEGKRPLRRRPRPEENGSAGLPSLQIASLEVKRFFGGKIAAVLLHLFFSQISHTRLLLRPKYRGSASEAHLGVFAWRALSRKKMIGFFLQVRSSIPSPGFQQRRILAAAANRKPWWGTSGEVGRRRERGRRAAAAAVLGS